MNPRTPTRPVSRPRVLLGALLLFAALGGVIAVSEGLRHPPAAEPVPLEPDEGDIRDEVECPPPALDGTPVGGPEASPVSPRSDAVEVDSEDLYDCPASYDGLLVTYQGEAVGAVLHRRDGAWTQLNDDAYADARKPLPAHRQFRGSNAGVGVHLPPDLADEIVYVGGPRSHGDLVMVTGTFHRMDSQSTEAAVIRAETGRVERRGEPIEHAPLRDRQVVGLVLALAAAAVTVARLMARRR